MAACSSCFATVRDDQVACPRCGRAVSATPTADDRPTIAPWTSSALDPSPAAAVPTTPSSAPPEPAPAPDATGPVEGPTAEPSVPAAGPPLGAPWVPPAPGPSAPPPAAPWVAPTPTEAPPSSGAPPAGWPPVAPGHPPQQPGWPPPQQPGWPPPQQPGWPPPQQPGWPPPGAWTAPQAGPGFPVAEAGREPNPDRSNAVVLVVISTLVIAAIVAVALLASNGIGPTREELQLERSLRGSTVVEQVREVPDGR